MELFLNDLFDFIKEIINIPPKVFAAYIQVLFRPHSYFNSSALDWGIKYFSAGLGLMAFLFSYTIPSEEYSRNRIFKWLIQIPMRKLMGLLSKGGVLYLSALFSVPVIIIYLLSYLFSDTNIFMPYMYVLMYSTGTVYLTVSFCIMTEHLVMKGIKSVSILEAWKVTMEEGMELENRLKNNPMPKDKKNKKETFWQHSNRVAKIGTIAAAPFRKKITLFQKILLTILFFFGFAHPFFCLVVVKF